MAVSTPVRIYYAERIFAQSGRDQAPPNFRPLDVTPTGRFTVEGCRGGGKNILEIQLVADAERVLDLRLACGLCNPAMYVGADVVADWARGRSLDEIQSLDPLDVPSLAPFFERLGGPGRPDDAREKFQYVLLALQRAVLDHRGEPAPPMPEIAEQTGRDLDDED